jgi:hypothetical protein
MLDMLDVPFIASPLILNPPDEWSSALAWKEYSYIDSEAGPLDGGSIFPTDFAHISHC